MASLSDLVSFSLLSLLLLCSCSTKVHGGDNCGFHVVPVDSLIPAETCSTPNGSRVNSLKILHRYGPCSPLGGKTKPGLQKLLLQDHQRVQSLHQRLRHSSKGGKLQAFDTTLPASSGATLGAGNYIVTIGLGTPKKDQAVMFDTGSDVSWVQCQPCARFCHNQQDPIFDPSASTSYRNVSCEATACRQLHINGCTAGSCLYGVLYGDNSSTVGLLSQDTLTLASKDVFQNFVFGCGQNNQGLFGRTAGLLGLSRDALSMVSQTSEKYGKIFSYCLPVRSSSTGDLTFGTAKASSVSYTPMVADQRAPSLYALELTGISVGGQLLTVSSSVFSTAGIIIDSGTVVTRLPPTAYEALRSAFRSGMTGYPLGPPLGLLDTCYDLSGQNTISVPTVALHFSGGVDVKLDIPGIFVVASLSQVCLGFAGNRADTSIGIIGNIQQRGVEVVYDLAAARIGFGPGTCS